MEQKNNSKDVFLSALAEAAGGLKRFKKTQLSEIFDEVAEFRKKGLSRKQIAAVLTQQGLPMSEGVYASTMSRIKKERQEKNEVKTTETKMVVVAERKQVTNKEADSGSGGMNHAAALVEKAKKVETTNTTGISREEMITMTNIPGLIDRKYKPQKPKGDSK